jgi:hypothetical protein
MSIVLVGSSSGSITLQEPAVAGTTTLNLPATSGTVVVTGTTPTLNGITFPATQVPSADANTLDDYEEGTWTPVVPATSVTYTNRYGTYTKIGNVVFIHCFVEISSISGASGAGGAAFISGLPFTSTSATNAYYPQFTTSWGGSNWGGSIGIAQVLPSQTALSGLGSTNNSAFVDSIPSNIWDSANNFVKLSGFYYV